MTVGIARQRAGPEAQLRDLDVDRARGNKTDSVISRQRKQWLQSIDHERRLPVREVVRAAGRRAPAGRRAAPGTRGARCPGPRRARSAGDAQPRAEDVVQVLLLRRRSSRSRRRPAGRACRDRSAGSRRCRRRRSRCGRCRGTARRRRAATSRVALAGRELQDLEGVAVGVPEVEGLMPPAFGFQSGSRCGPVEAWLDLCSRSRA